jgi:FAD/FMN-containing dehydrogenase
MNDSSLPRALQSLIADLGDLRPELDPERLDKLSKDFGWFSPISAPLLRDKRAEVGFAPMTEDEIRRIVAACAKHRVPLCVRGGGTGNYGQITPLAGGVMLDLSRYNRILWTRSGVMRAQAGTRLGNMEREARTHGWELRMMPSTYRIATVGGFYSGGTGGIGSINYGLIAGRGNVLGVRAIDVVESPAPVELRGDDVQLLMHGWGIAGIVLEVELALAPAIAWDDTIAVFADFDDALECANELAHSYGIAKRLVSFHVDPVPQYLVPLAAHLPAGKHAILACIAEYAMEPWRALVAKWRGEVTYHKPAEASKKALHTLVEFSWNHTTLNAHKVERGLTNTQMRFVPGKHLEQIRAVYKALHPELMLHTEFIRDPNGLTTCSSLPIIRYTTPERIEEIHAIARSLGVIVANPHTFQLNAGNKKDVTSSFYAAKRRFDPYELLNPGKLASP